MRPTWRLNSTTNNLINDKNECSSCVSRDFNIVCSQMNRSKQQEVRKGTAELSNTMLTNRDGQLEVTLSCKSSIHTLLTFTSEVHESRSHIWEAIISGFPNLRVETILSNHNKIQFKLNSMRTESWFSGESTCCTRLMLGPQRPEKSLGVVAYTHNLVLGSRDEWIPSQSSQNGKLLIQY